MIEKEKNILQGKIIKELRNSRNLTQEQLGENVNVTTSTIGMIETGSRSAGRKLLERLSDFFEVSIDYLLGKETSSNTLDIHSIDSVLPLKNKRIPILGQVACGTPIYAEEDYIDYTHVDEKINADFGLFAKGNSMEPLIFDGDLILIQKMSIVDEGEIACVIIDNETTLKRFYRSNGFITLVAENPTFRPIIISENDDKTIQILGKAIAFQRNL